MPIFGLVPVPVFIVSLAVNYVPPVFVYSPSFPVAQVVEHDASNAKIMGSIPRESKS